MSKSFDEDKIYKEQLEHNYLNYIGHEHVNNICDNLDANKEEINEIEIPEHLHNWFEDFVKMEVKRNKKQKRRAKYPYKMARRIAVVLIFVIGVNFLLIKNVSAYRFELFKVVVNIKEIFTQINYVKNDETSFINIPDGWVAEYFPFYIPKGYQLESSRSTERMSSLLYLNDKEERIIFKIYKHEVSVNLDSENGKVRTVFINNKEAIMIEKEDFIMINWVLEDQFFLLETQNLSFREAITIAEKVQPVPEENK